jgi:hypothetical protein
MSSARFLLREGYPQDTPDQLGWTVTAWQCLPHIPEEDPDKWRLSMCPDSWTSLWTFPKSLKGKHAPLDRQCRRIL